MAQTALQQQAARNARETERILANGRAYLAANAAAQSTPAPAAASTAAPPPPPAPKQERTGDYGTVGGEVGAMSHDELLSAVMRKKGIRKGSTIFAGEGGYRPRPRVALLGQTRPNTQPTLG